MGSKLFKFYHFYRLFKLKIEYWEWLLYLSSETSVVIARNPDVFLYLRRWLWCQSVLRGRNLDLCGNAKNRKYSSRHAECDATKKGESGKPCKIFIKWFESGNMLLESIFFDTFDSCSTRTMLWCFWHKEKGSRLLEFISTYKCSPLKFAYYKISNWQFRHYKSHYKRRNHNKSDWIRIGPDCEWPPAYVQRLDQIFSLNITWTCVASIDGDASVPYVSTQLEPESNDNKWRSRSRSMWRQ